MAREGLRDKEIHLAVHLLAPLDYPSLVRAAHTAENGLFDFLLLAGPATMPMLSAVAAQSDHLGLIGTVEAALAQPFEVARQLATLDHLSDGRSGWSVALAPDGASVQRATEVVAAARAFWDSWEAGAVQADEHTGRYADPDRIHAVDFRGAHVDVRGYATVPAGPQGHPVLLQDVDSPGWEDFAAEHADVVVTRDSTDAKARAAALGRDPARLRAFAPTAVTGPAEQVATRLEQLVQSDACDGFLLGPGGLDEFVDSVVPLLQKRGRYRTAYGGSTLRTHLGL